MLPGFGNVPKDLTIPEICAPPLAVMLPVGVARHGGRMQSAFRQELFKAAHTGNAVHTKLAVEQIVGIAVEGIVVRIALIPPAAVDVVAHALVTGEEFPRASGRGGIEHPGAVQPVDNFRQHPDIFVV